MNQKDAEGAEIDYESGGMLLLNTTRWQRFFSDFAASHTAPDAQISFAYWNQFFKRFVELRPVQATQPRRIIAPQGWADFFAYFAVMRDTYRKQGKAVDVWELAGIGRDELRNSAILGWLLNCHGSHGQGDAFLRAFLAQCGYDQDSIASMCVHGYRTTVEESNDEYEVGSDKQRSRVDIVLEGPAFLLLIEVKVQSGETDNQLERYLRIGRARAGVRFWRLVYLTLDGRLPKDAALQGEVDCARWRDLGLAFLRHVDSMPADSQGTVVIRQFCEHIITL